MSTGTALTTDAAPRAVASLTGGMVTAIVPQTFDDVYRFAQVVSQSGLCPYGMDTPQKVTVAILTGLEIGVKPMQAVQGIAVIGGRPCIWGDLALGIVRGSGQLEYIKETYEGDEDAVDWMAKDPEKAAHKFKAVCIVKRRGEPEARTEFSIGDAIVAKLWGKRGHNGKDTPWITNPKRMLKMRARGFNLRDQFTDALKGLRIAEEMIGTDDDQDQPASLVAPPPPPSAVAGPATPRLAPTAKPVDPAPPPPSANANTGPAAPPAEDIEEAEIVEAPAGQNLPQEEHELLAEAGAFKGDPAHPPLAQEEPFDPEAFLDDAKDRFDQAKTSADVDAVHEVFGDDANELLGMIERQKYQDIHEAAVIRTAAQDQVQQPPPAGQLGPAQEAEDEDDTIDDGSFPGNDAIAATAPQKTAGELYLQRIRVALADPTRPFPSIAGLWNATKAERAELIEKGEITKAQSKELQGEIEKRGEQAQAERAPPAGPGPSAPPAEEDEITAYDRAFRARVEACKTTEEVGALSAGTLQERAKFSGSPLQKEWTGLIANRRKAIAGIA